MMNARRLTHRTRVGLCLGLLLSGCASLANQDYGRSGEQAEPLPDAGNVPSYAQYKTPIDTEVLDRTFRPKEAMYLASEMQLASFPLFEGALIKGLIDDDPEFQYMTTVEAYWYSRYNMSSLVTESRLGVHTVYGPYVTEWALREGKANVNRDRLEYTRSNKGVFLQEIVPMYLERTGFPRRFEDASPTMLQFAAGDPHYVRPLDKGVHFESTENLVRDAELRKLYGDRLPERGVGAGVAGNDMWKARVNYRENFLSLRWNHNRMDHTIDLGAEGQVLMKQALWAEYFFQQNHHGGRFLGNDPEEGFRGSMLNLMAINKMLMLKGALLYDGSNLGGADPRTARAGEFYFPHRVAVRMRMVGDLPPRAEEFSVEDPSSQLFDQASLLWGLGEYYHFADPATEDNWDSVFGDDPPYDGSIMEQKYLALAEGLSNLIVRNLDAMHRTESGALASVWTPEDGVGSSVTTESLAMAMVALANYVSNVGAPEGDLGTARNLLRGQADFITEVLQAADGSVANGYDTQSQAALDTPASLLVQGFTVRGLVEAYKVLGDSAYLEAAQAAYGFMNARLWDDATGVYRSHLNASVSEYTPLTIGAAIGAMREMILVTEDVGELERFKRFWVQAVNSSGLQQSEYEETGEKDFFKADGDGDGIPRMEYGDGKYGIAPVFASRIRILTPVTRAAAR